MYGQIICSMSNCVHLAGAKRGLFELGYALKSMTDANQGIPPICASFDGGGGNHQCNAALLGVLPSGMMKDAPFFSDCRKIPLDLPMWPYSAIKFQGKYFISGCNDCNHVMKRYAFHLSSGTRMASMGSAICNLTPMIVGGLSVRALSAKDIQSDADMSRKMNSAHIPRDWRGLGCAPAHFINGLLTSAWTACEAFSFKESVANALMAFYVLLGQASEACRQHGKKWPLHFVPIQTLRNMCDLAGHLVLAAAHWPSDLPWSPKSRQESPIEGMFGRMKAGTRGSATLKDFLYGCHFDHLKQHRQSAMWDKFENNRFAGSLTSEELQAMAGGALKDACQFLSWISDSRTSGDIEKDLQMWWQKIGMRLLKERGADFSSSTDEGEPEHCYGEDFDPIFEDAQLDGEDLADGEVDLSKSWRDGIGVMDNEPDEDCESLLQNLESRRHVVEEIQKISAIEDASKQSDSAQAAQLPTAAPQTMSSVSVAEQPHESETPQVRYGSFVSVQAAVAGDQRFVEGSKEYVGKNACIYRLEKLFPPLTTFVKKVRLAEGLLSETQFLLTALLCMLRNMQQRKCKIM